MRRLVGSDYWGFVGTACGLVEMAAVFDQALVGCGRLLCAQVVGTRTLCLGGMGCGSE